LEKLSATLAETERTKRTLQLELDEVVSNKDDQGRSVHELEKAKRELEKRCSDQAEQIEELEVRCVGSAHKWQVHRIWCNWAKTISFVCKSG
jgi:uncharacterized protein YoxC